jgi:hypothetical protein
MTSCPVSVEDSTEDQRPAHERGARWPSMERTGSLSRGRLAGHAPGRGSCFLVVLLIASTAFAQAPADAPLADPDAQGRSLILEQGEITPYRGVLLDEQEAVRRERARVRAEATLQKAEEGVLLPRGALIAIISGVAAVSAAAAAGVTAWALKR